MPLLTKLRSFFRNLVSRQRIESDLSEEMNSYLELLTREKTTAGLSSQEAKRAARLELGGVEQVKEQVRDQRLGNWIHSVLSDARYTLRQFRKNPVFTAVAILTLALGIGATTSIFSAIDGVLLHPYPYNHADRLATFTIFAGDQFRAWRVPARAFVDFKEHNRTFDDMFGLVYREVHLARSGGTEEFFGGSLTPGAFESLGVAPLHGRTFTADDFRPDAAPVFVISDRLWTKLSSRDPHILGATYTLNGIRTTLIGIMPSRFQIGGCDLWVPLDVTRDMFVPGSGIQSNEIWTVGHLKVGVRPETAAADLQVIAAPFQKDDPIYFPPNFKIIVKTFNDDAVRSEVKVGLFTLMAAVLMLLLIACSNTANLLLARATTREREFGIRSALGAGNKRMVQQLLIESCVLALASCALGCLLAFCGLKAVIALIPAETIPWESSITLNSSALIFSLTVTLFTTLVCGLGPALRALRTNPQIALSSAGKGTNVGVRHGKLRSVLVVAEVALSIVLAICSGLIMRSLFALQQVNLGFNPSKVLYAHLSWPETRYNSVQQKNVAFRKLLDRLTNVPGVVAATAASSYPPHTWGWTTVAIQGKIPPQNRNTAAIFCTEGYFQTLNRPLLRGASFTQQDIDSVRRLAVVNQSFVRDRFGEENPLGRLVRLSDFETLSDWPRDPYFEIVGVVSDAPNTGLRDAPLPEIYLPATLTADGPRNLMVRVSAGQPSIVRQIRDAVAGIDPDIAIGETGTIATLLLHDYFARPRFLSITLSTFAAIALLLVAAGIFSVVSYSIALRTHEIGVRVALGAQRAQVLTLVLRNAMPLILAGIGIGLVVSCGLARGLAAQFWGVPAADPGTFAFVALLALVVGASACLVPARRATKIDPLVALRYE